MRSIFKYQITSITYLPKGSQILHIGIQRDELFVWALVPMEPTETEVRLLAYPTGHLIDDDLSLFKGTFFLNGGEFVIHVFEKTCKLSTL